jgi:glycosyltransferase involved in cell wall biosynthesis
MVIVTGFYNAEQYVAKSILSIMTQTHKDFTCYITHDMSTDNSVKIIKELIKNDLRFILVDEYDKKLYPAGNFDRTIRNNPKISDDEVIIEVDGDDWLPDTKVFERIHNLYKDKNVWIANGSFKYSNGQPGFSSPQTDFDNLRNSRFTASHIRTWRAFLWRNIKEEDLRDDDGNYWQWSGDLCFMFPMLEMSGPQHYRFMKDVNYVYNAENPINEHKVDMTMVNNHAERIRNKKPYTRLIKK